MTKLSLSRRGFLASGAALLTLPLLGGRVNAKPAALEILPSKTDLTGVGRMTDVLTYGGSVPGAVLRVKQGERLTIEAINRLSQETTIHWHGIRLPNAMDGVPGLSQPAIEPGGSFTYDFICPDAGTFWYHPHVNSAEQLARGLFGALIVEETQAPLFDRDELWVLNDWRLDEGAELANDFRDPFDQMHDGRIGNVVTLNGKAPATWQAKAGEIVRLRLLNASSARIFALAFDEKHPFFIIATDGQPCRPHQPAGGLLWLGPGQRVDLQLFTLGDASGRYSVVDHRNANHPAPLVEILYSNVPSTRMVTPAPIQLPPNPLTQPDLASAESLSLLLTGGMQHGSDMGSDMGGDMSGGEGHNMPGFWQINGQTHQGHDDPPLWNLALGKTYRITMKNKSDFFHPMHIHGMHWKLLSENGVAASDKVWRDTLLIAPKAEAEVALVADNPGTWMLHCHVLDHQETGMAALVQVA